MATKPSTDGFVLWWKTSMPTIIMVHYGTKPGHFETSKIYSPTSERCERTSEWTSEWPSTYVSILVSQWDGDGPRRGAHFGQHLDGDLESHRRCTRQRQVFGVMNEELRRQTIFAGQPCLHCIVHVRSRRQDDEDHVGGAVSLT